MNVIDFKLDKLDVNDQRQKKMDILNSKISLVLPELMSRNLKLGERLKNKLKVSTLFNNIEHRNRKYLKGFILSSNKRAKDLKTGLEMNKAVKQSTKKLTLLRNQMKDDLILKNSNILLREKKLLSENTEQETHLKINDFIHTIKNAIKPQTIPKVIETKKIIKSLSDEELSKVKDIIDNRIIKEENDIKDKINAYIDKMRNSFDNNNNYQSNKLKIKKNFIKYVDNMYLENGFKLINYKKARPQQIKDKESSNLIRIKKFLYPSNFEDLKKEIKSNKALSKISNGYFLKRNSSMHDIYKRAKSIRRSQIIDSKIGNVEVSGKDTMEVLNDLVIKGEYLSQRLADKMEKVNALIEKDLPYPINYELILLYMKKHNILKNHYSNDKKELSPITEENSKIKMTPDIRNKILMVKDDINTKKDEFLEKYLNNINAFPFIKSQKLSPINMRKIYNNSDRSIINNKSSDNIDSTSVDFKSGETVFITNKKKLSYDDNF